jgi:heat shock protein HtpX
LHTVKNIFKKSNIGTIIFFILNAMFVMMLFSGGGRDALITVFFLYVASILLAFSPFGEWMLCFFAGAKKMVRADMQARMNPLLDTVVKNARRKTPEFTRDVRLKVIYTPDPAAYAIGRRTICVTEGLFRLPDNLILGILSHEVAHLSKGHNDVQLLIGGGNFVITILIFLVKAFAVIVAAFSIIQGFKQRSLLTAVAGVLFAAVIWMWTKFCLLFLRWSMRANEYEADAYAVDLGYGYELAEWIDSKVMGVPQDPFLKALFSVHPNGHERIAKIQAMGVPYSSYT